jgi:hypothetical protein
MAQGRGSRYIGGANVPTKTTRVNISWPMAELTTDGSSLRLRFRGPGRLFKLLFSAQSLSASVSDAVRVYPVRGIMGSGVGMTTADSRDFYFWTRKCDAILGQLRDAGYSVSDVAEKPPKFWQSG